MLDFAKERSFWDHVRESDEFARHRKEIKEKYDWAFKEKPQLMSYDTYFGKGDQGNLWYRQLFQLQSSAMMSLIYYDNDEYFKNLIDIIWVYCGEYSWSPLGHHNSYYDTTPDEYDPALIDIYAASIGFTMAILIFAGVRERLNFAEPPKAFSGMPLALITAGIIAMAFSGFSGIKL